MKPLVPAPREQLKFFRKSMIRWGLKILAGELARRPAKTLPMLRRFKRMYRATNLLRGGTKVMQFGEDGDSPCMKMAVYIPHWPSKALEMRTRRALRSDTFWHEQVTLSITDSCPYKCRHCSNTRGRRKPLPQSRLIEVVREIQEIGGGWLNIGGGEPGVVFERALAVVAAAGDKSETVFNTTGFNLDADKVKRLKDAGLFGGRVSIHSHKADEHDDFVGYRGAFKIAANAIQTFRQADIFPVISASIPEEHITLENILEMMKLGKDLGTGFVEIIPLRPVGRAVIACSNSELQRHDISSQIFKTLNTDPCYADYPGVNSAAYLETPDRFGCTAGAERIYISAAGDVQPCPLVCLSLGNVLDEPLVSICRRMQSVVQGPRTELLCSHLGPIVSDYVKQGEQGCDVLPIPPDKSMEILSNLPTSTTPKAWVL